MKRRDTKSLLLEHGTRLLMERGYHATGIQDVLAAAALDIHTNTLGSRMKKLGINRSTTAE